MKAMILAGGEGKRLRPLTDKLPKPMVPIMNQPMMAYLLKLLKKHDITEIGIALGYCRDAVTNYFKNGEDFGVHLTYFNEDSPKGTAGCLTAAKDFLNEDFVVISGDAVTDLNLTSALYFHKDKNALATVILKESETPTHQTVMTTDENSRLIHVASEPDWNEVRSDTIATGMYIMKPEILSHIPQENQQDFIRDIIPKLIYQNLPVYGYVMENYWCDISDIIAYRHCHRDIFNGRVKLGIPEDILKSGILIGKNCNMAEDVHLGRYTVIGDNTVIEKGASVRDSILWSGSRIPEHADLYKTVTCGTDIIHAPQNEEDVSSPEINRNRAEGRLNENITPEWICELALAYASCFPPEAKILLSLSDQSRYMMPKFSFLSGLIAGGVICYNLVGAGDRSLAKFALRKFSLDGGIHVQCDGELMFIEFVDENGSPADKATMKKLRSFLKSKDYRRASIKELHAPVNIHDMPLYYFKDLVTTTPCKRLNFSVGVCTHSEELKEHLKKISNAFGMSVLFTNDAELLPDLITENKLHLGLLVGENGKCAFYNEHGKVLSGDQFYGLVTLMVLSALEEAVVYMPQHASDIVSQIAKHCNGTVERIPDHHLEKVLLKSNTPAARLQHDLLFDPIRSLVRVCEFLFLNRCSLSHVCSILPHMHKISRSVGCPKEKKGAVMRHLLDVFAKNKQPDLTEGIKLTDEHGWILIMPDYRKNRIHILSESRDEEYACELAGTVCDTIKQLTHQTS